MLPAQHLEDMAVARATKYVPKKKPAALKRSAPINGKTASVRPLHEDDLKITALALPPGKLSPEMEAYFNKCDEKLGFVPNVLKAFAFDDAKLQAFVNYRQELVQNAANLSKLEIEMIATAVSAQNRCFYCITAHGNSVRQLGDPILGEMMVQNYRAARLSKRQRAMLDFAVKLTTTPWEVEEKDRKRLRRAGRRCGADHQNNDQDHGREQNERENRAPGWRLVGPLGRACLPLLGIASEHADDIIDPAGDTPGEIPFTKARRNRVRDDEARHRIGERPLKPVPDLDAHLALIRRHDQEDAVVLVLLSDLPGAPELNAKILDGCALQRSQRHHDHLVRRFGFEIGKLLAKCRASGLIEHAGLVHHAPAERGQIERLRHRDGHDGKKQNANESNEVMLCCCYTP
jgi:uncharacterized peroxidase-related enzyme